MSGRKLSVLEGVETEEREVSFSAEMKGSLRNNADTSLKVEKSRDPGCPKRMPKDEIEE